MVNLLYLVKPSTVDGAKDVLLQYGQEYCIVYSSFDFDGAFDNTCKKTLGYWLVNICDIEACVVHNAYVAELSEKRKLYLWLYTERMTSPTPYVQMPDDIMVQLMNE